jgi:hypothetical protein
MSHIENGLDVFFFHRAFRFFVEVGYMKSVKISVLVEQSHSRHSAPLAVSSIPHLFTRADDAAAFQLLAADEADNPASSFQRSLWSKPSATNSVQTGTSDRSCDICSMAFRDHFRFPFSG